MATISPNSTLPGARKKAPAGAIALPWWLAEFALLRTAALTCGGVIALGAAALLASGWHVRESEAALKHAQLLRNASYSRFALADQEKLEIRQFQPQFVALRNKGLIGDENRLDWIDQIRAIQQRRRLLPLSYEIEPLQPVRQEPGVALGDYLLHASRMRLHMDLLHEGDLFDFLGDLKRRGYFAVQDCAIRRAGGAVNVANTPTLTADCRLNWLTMVPGPAADTQAGVAPDSSAAALKADVARLFRKGGNP